MVVPNTRYNDETNKTMRDGADDGRVCRICCMNISLATKAHGTGVCVLGETDIFAPQKGVEREGNTKFG